LTCPEIEREEIYDIYKKKGFKGKLLDQIVDNITSNKKRWKDIMMKEELGLSNEFNNPIKSMIVVFFSSVLGSIIPLFPFFFFPLYTALVVSLIVSAIALFITGALEAKFTLGNWITKGLQLTLIGMAAAVVGFIVGKLTGTN
jgi:vacuolar iron transporter family protein